MYTVYYAPTPKTHTRLGNVCIFLLISFSLFCIRSGKFHFEDTKSVCTSLYLRCILEDNCVQPSYYPITQPRHILSKWVIKTLNILVMTSFGFPMCFIIIMCVCWSRNKLVFISFFHTLLTMLTF